MDTRITRLLNIKYPLFQGGMAWVSESGLASAVSNGGGLGLIAAGNAPHEWLREQIRMTRTMTEKPFGVNIMMMSPEIDAVIDVVCQEKVAAVTTGAGNPSRFMARFKEAGIKVFPVVPSVTLAKVMQRAGADGVVAEGCESGGHIGELTTMALVPQVVRNVSIPVLAAGGIASGEGAAAAFCLGAEGIQCGTVFLASSECKIHEEYKKLIISANDTATAVTGRSTGLPVRAIKNELTRTILEMEQSGKSREEVELFTIGSLRKAVADGDLNKGTFMAGQIAGLVNEILPCSKIIVMIFEGAKEILGSTAARIKF